MTRTANLSQEKGTAYHRAAYMYVRKTGDRKRAEAALRQSERRLSEVLESVSDGFFTVDPDWRVTVFNRACENGFATDRGNVLGKLLWDVFPRLRGTEFETRLRAVAETGLADSLEADSIVIPGGRVEVRAAPKEDGGIAVAFSDITERKRAEEQRQLLVNELNHRVKNTLSVVQAIAAQSFRADAPMDAARQAFAGRLATLAAAHTLLTSQNWQDTLLSEVVESTIVAAADRERFVVEGPDVQLAPQTAVSFSLALHELCTNAMKYGALRSDDGRVTIGWEVAPDADGAPRLRFVWAESDGPAVVPPDVRGFGSRLLETGLARELRGTVILDFEPDGLKCRIDVPLPAAG